MENQQKSKETELAEGSDLFDFQTDKYIETPWTIIESYFEGHHLERLVRHQLESYNNFVNNQIMKTIDMFNPVHILSDTDYNKELKVNGLEIFIEFTNLHIYRPQIHENNGSTKLMFPQDARLRNFTYASTITIDINIKYLIRNGSNMENVQIFHKNIPNIHIGKLPIMVKSDVCVLNQYKHLDTIHTGECDIDAGGYFIINGLEKTVLGQERAAENKVYCFNTAKNSTKYNWSAEMKSVPDFKCISPKQFNMMISSKNNGFGYPIVVQIPKIKQPVPLFVLFRALGIISDKNICDIILLDIHSKENEDLLQALNASIIDSNTYLTQDECIKYINTFAMYTPASNIEKELGYSNKIEFTKNILQTDIFPHCHNITQKIYLLGYMANRILKTSFEYMKPDDRDSFVNKRIDLTGSLLNNLLRNYFNKLVRDMEKQIEKELKTGSWRSTQDYENIINMTNIYKIIKSNTIENGFKKALATGDFSIKNTNSNKVGVAQLLSRMNYVSSLSHSRRISTPTDKSGKLIPPRKLHSTSWGYICPAETPEGQSVGVVKNLACEAVITIHSNSIPLHEIIYPMVITLDKEGLLPVEISDHVKVFINGAWIGITKEPETLYNVLKDKKHRGIINIYTSILFDYKMKEIKVCNDSGRLVRPVLRVENKNVLINKSIIQCLKNKEIGWDDLFIQGKLKSSVLEYIDPEEQSLSLIATKPKDLVVKSITDKDMIYKYTHCEIHPSTILGVLASCIPFPEHNQSPRNVYQCAQSKQAMSIYATNYASRLDKTAYILNYPTRPLVDTRIMNMLKLEKVPNGTNVIVAIMTHTGYNQEDSLLFNKSSIDRGLFLATIYHTEKDEDKQKVNGDEEIRGKPDSTKTKKMKMGANYEKVNSKGLVPENTFIENRDIIIAKMVPIKENRNDHTKLIKYEDESKMYRTCEETFIDKNYIDRNEQGYSMCKVRLRTMRKPVIGDKFSSRHGQKGTIGNIIPEEDMPYTATGVRPDIIINPHAIPSRMTIGQLKETLLGKVLVELGLFGDGTSFGELEVDDIRKKLLEIGYECNGNELLYSGLTGEQVECSVFIGPVFYQRLKHMVNDKTHSRSIGPMVNLTRQPAEGRSRDGGLRFGEMEKDAMVSHGAARFTRGRLYDASDKYSVYVCKKCGMIAAYNDAKKIHHCRTCNNRTDFSYVELPYSCKLLFQELITMNVAPRILT
jgi:DNA-directed RNA polymerase II subunit RPB2